MEEKAKVYSYAQMCQVLSDAANGKRFHSTQIHKLIDAGEIIKILPPNSKRGVYTKASVHAYAEKLKEFYSKVEM